MLAMIAQLISEGNFHHYFQPIFSFDYGKEIGFEALIRSSKFPNPEKLFQEAEKENRLYELDSHSIYKALSTYLFAGSPILSGSLFVNAFPSTILSEKFPSFLNSIVSDKFFSSQRIVFELSESEIITDYDILKERIEWIKSKGCLIAIDDVGKGYTNVQTLIELEPDFLKLDQYFSRDLYTSTKKQLFIDFYVNYCRQNNIRLILEGIENSSDMETAKKLGVEMGQGYYLGRPTPLREIV
ncbi:EAL domain-containing protein [Bacillaceae bacterium S4-13-58]